MIKFGDIYLNEDYVEAVAPRPGGGDAYDAVLASGRVVGFIATREDVQAAFGMMSNAFNEVVIELSPAEIDELRRVKSAGACYIAKDKNGRVYAFHGKPQKCGGYWEDVPGDDTFVLRGHYTAVSYDDEEPCRIDDLLGGDIDDGI